MQYVYICGERERREREGDARDEVPLLLREIKVKGEKWRERDERRVRNGERERDEREGREMGRRVNVTSGRRQM